jgi:hypothetical protein
MIKRRQTLGNILSDEDIRAVLRQRALLAGRLSPPISSNSCAMPPHLYTAWSDSSTTLDRISSEILKRLWIAQGVRVVNQQEAEARETARIFAFEKPFPKDETPYDPVIPDVPKILKLRK